MELPEELDDFIKHSIDNTLGLAVPNKTLQLKVQSLETSNHLLRNQYLTLLSKIRQKEQAVELARAEACLNAQAIKKFVEENQKLAAECADLVNQCTKLERECSLYDHDREALMEFGNEADGRAKEAEMKVSDLEDDLKELSEAVKQLSEEVKYYKHQCEMLSDGSCKDSILTEQKLLNTLVASLVNKNDVAKTASAFLEANSGIVTCSELLKMWNSLIPETQNVLSLAAHVRTLEKDKRTLEKDKEHLRINLHRAEEEVRVLFEENHVLDEENKRLLRVCKSEKKHASSGGKHDSSTKTKNNKRKTSPGMMSSPVDRKIDFNDFDTLRHPLSPLKENSPNSKSHKKGQK